MVLQLGVEANLNKVQSILDMMPPKKVNEG